MNPTRRSPAHPSGHRGRPPRHPATALVMGASLAFAAVMAACGPEDAAIAAVHGDAVGPVLVAQVEPAAPPVRVTDRREIPAPRHLGRVRSIDPLHAPRRATGDGAVIGGVAGGVVGHQIGSGTGQTAATVVGAVGGAVAGNQIEKRRGDKVVGHRVTVEMDSGEVRTVEVGASDGIAVGDQVRVEGNQLIKL